jgi:hypothetical protein
MGKYETYLTTFDISAVEYFDLMLDASVQEEIHTAKDGLRMSVWRASDAPLLGVPNGVSRVVFSEPDLKIPKFLKKWVQKAQSYNEYSDFYPPRYCSSSSSGEDDDKDDDGEKEGGEDMVGGSSRRGGRATTASKRKCVVVPHVGANRMTMTFTEYYTEHEESTSQNPKCLVRSEVFVEVRAPLIGRKMEEWILNTSREKVEERDAFVRRMLEKSKSKRGGNRKEKSSSGKNETWRRKFYSSQWFEEDSALEESVSEEPVEEKKKRTSKSGNELKLLESLESFPIAPKKKVLRRIFSARDLAI